MVAPSKKSQGKSRDAKPKFNKTSKKDFKPKKTSKELSRNEPAAMQLEDDVPDFPRGGGSSLSRQERDQIRAEVDAEFEAEERGMKNNKKKKPRKENAASADDLGSLFGDGITGKLPKYANRITLKNITPGMKLLGVVSEVNEKDLVVSLPGGLRGLVRAADAFDPVLNTEDNVENEENLLPTIFHTGQLVACVVLHLDDDKKESGKRKIWLSLRLSMLHTGFTLDSVQEGMVLAGYVKSVEDHGYILHFGLSSFMGFLPRKSKAGVDVEARTGQLLQGVVGRIDKNRKVVHLSSDAETVSKFVTKDLKGISIDLLIPGMMVNASVRSILESGVMLSFLTYFTGTADMFHLQNKFPTKNWKEEYSQNKKVNARILFIDPSTRAIGLTLNPHIVHNKAPPSHVKVGDIYEKAKVIRIDRGQGLLLDIPSSPMSTPAYVSISDVAEEDVRKLEKKFKEGSHVRVRVSGFRHLDGLATGTLKASAFEGPVFTHSDVKPGMVVKAKIVAVDSFGAIVLFPGGVKALCPVRHMSEYEIAKPGKKFQVGAELVFRVLGCKSKRITVTHKKSLVKSKLSIVASYADATDGLITHGWITKIEQHGCYVHFYNGVQGFAPRSELGLELGADPSSMYHVGQVVKCRVIGSNSASRRIILSFLMKSARVPEDEMLKMGSIVSGVVECVTPQEVFVCVNGKTYLKGTITPEHLADHHDHAVSLKSVLKPGYVFDQLLVLEVEASNMILSAKYSLINSADQLPSDLSQIQPNTVVHGYVCNLIENGCFVRFLGRLTGFSPRNKAMDDHKADLSGAFFIGQSVRSNIVDVNNETERITVSLKQSCCSSTDASFIQEYFTMGEKIAELQSSEAGESDVNWSEGFNIGNIVHGKIQETKDIGVVVSFDENSNLLGFITHYQLGGVDLETGSTVQAAVLDISKSEHLVDLSLKPEFVGKPKEKRSKSKTPKKRKSEAIKELEMHQTVNAVVEIVKEDYLVLSLPDFDSAIGYASVVDYNTQKLPRKQYVNGQSVTATIMALPTPSTAGRLLLLLKSISKVAETSGSKRAKRKSSYDVGSLVQAEITEVKPLELRVQFGTGFSGRIHITEVSDDGIGENPFCNFKVGQTVSAKIVAKSDSKKGNQWDLSIKPTTLAGTGEIGEEIADKEMDFSPGEVVSGYVYKVDSEWAWLRVSRHVNAQLHILDSSSDPAELQEFQKLFYVGKTVSGHVLNINKEKKLLRLVRHPLHTKDNKKDESSDVVFDYNGTSHIQEGDIVGARISRILPGVGGMLVQIGPHTYGRAHFTELKDAWVPDPLSGYHEGQFVKCKVLEISKSVNGNAHIDLSLRFSLDGMLPQNDSDASSKRIEKIEDLAPDMVVQGYVKNIVSKGCFILLSRKLDARILVSNLSDSFVESPEKEFHVGKLVSGRVLTVEPLSKRVEVTLKSSNASSTTKSYDFSNLHVGDIVCGSIKRVETYGLFISIDHTNMVGLCHVSELSDERIQNIEMKYQTGEKVKAKILKVDEGKRRISLGMKNSYFDDEDGDIQLPSEDESDEEIRETGLMDGTRSETLMDNMEIDFENRESSVLAQAESRAAIPPLEVSLDDIEESEIDNTVSNNQPRADEAVAVVEKNTRQKNKIAKEKKEQEIRAAEDRLLEKDAPKTADEFEKLIRSSPNSSFVWIKYVAFMLDQADVEQARSIVERALRTINPREEGEKLNIWVAYFNLENQYGNPPEEAVQKVFKRALQYLDSKKVHLALLEMYERTDQHKLANELLDKMTKKFKHSCKVWVKRVVMLLKQHQQDAIEGVLSRVALSLPRSKQVKFYSQAAIQAFKFGVPDTGRTLFENILREYPKRTDLWSVYLDQEIRLGDVEITRQLFTKAITIKLPPKKMKFLFEKYLKFEKLQGDEEKIEEVKQKAMQYVENALA